MRIYTPRRYLSNTLPTGFTYDPRINQVVCSAGATGRPSPYPNGGFLYVLSQRTSQRCTLKA